MTCNTTEQFIEKANALHNNKYDYSKTNYIDCNEKVIIICDEHGEFEQTPVYHLQPRICPQCAKKLIKHPTKLTNDDFLRRAKEVHGDRYDYSKTKYTLFGDKIIVTCKPHGDFYPSASNHLAGIHCPECAKLNRIATATRSKEDFLEKANKVHNNYYDYSQIEYVNITTHIKIICPKHGEFWQKPNRHLIGRGCYQHGIDKRTSKLTKSAENFIKQANIVHHNIYDYSKVEYKGTHIAVIIICKAHGYFMQSPHNHLNGADCLKCVTERIAKLNTLSPEEFIAKAKIVHENKYDYSETTYKRHAEKVKIICTKPGHGAFYQSPGNHLQGNGCPVCPHLTSANCKLWLDSLQIPDTEENREVTIFVGKRRFRVDGFAINKIDVYEFNGDYYHGNPNYYESADYNQMCKRTFGELYQRTLQKEKILKEAGYNVISIWESDFDEKIKRKMERKG